MNKNKNIDFTSLISEAIHSSKKELGLITEQEEELKVQEATSSSELAFNEPFNVEKHVQYMQVTPKKWGLKGTTDAAQIDKIIGAVTGGGTGIDNFKKAISNLNTILGKTPNNFSLPDASNRADLTISALNVFNSLQLNSLIHAIIYAQSPSVAGKMFEGLVSRLVGGKANPIDTIEDLVDDKGSLISLKLIDPLITTIQGSIYNLAKGLSSLPPDKGITYLVCIKSNQSNPFSFKTFSFTIYRHNFFNFALKNPGQLSTEDIQKARSVIITDDINQSVKKADRQESEEETLDESAKPKKVDRFTAKNYDPDEGFIDQSVLQYAANRGKANTAQTAIDYIKSVIDSNNELLGGAKKLSAGPNDNVTREISNNVGFIIKPSLWEGYLFPLRLNKVESAGKKAVTSTEFSRFRGAVKNFSEIAKQEDKKIEFFESDPNILAGLQKAQAEGRYEEEKQTILASRASYYNEQFSKLQKYLKPIIDFSVEIEKTLISMSSQELNTSKELGAKYKQTQAANATVGTEINKFFADIANDQVFFQKKKSSNYNISLNIKQAKQIALETDGNFDEDYEEFIVEGGVLFNNAEKSTEVLKKYLIPILSNYHEIDNGLKSYYIADQPYGMTHASEHLSKLKNNIDVQQKEKGNVAASKLTENKKKNLTNDFSESILEWVRNLE